MKRLINLRERDNLTQKEVAGMLGIHQSTYSNYENDNKTPEVTTLVKIADLFKVSTDYILERDSTVELKLPKEINNISDATLFLEQINLLALVSKHKEDKIIIFAKMLHMNITNFKW